MNKDGELVKAELDPEADLARLEADANLVEKRFGDGEPYEYERVVAQARAAKLIVADGFIELGRAILRIKAQEEHGKFMAALGVIGVEARSAQRYMMVAAAFGETKNLRALPLGKLDLLAQLGEGDIEDLDRGKLGKLKLDDLETMSRSELAAALRAERDRTGKRLKAAEQQYHQVKDELDFLKEGAGVTTQYANASGAAHRSLTRLLNLDLSDVEMEALDTDIALFRVQLDNLCRRVHPDVPRPDGDSVQGRIEAKNRAKKQIKEV